MLELVAILALNVILWPIFRYIGRNQTRRAKLMRLQDSARDWQASGYLIPMRFFWNGSNPVLLWRRQSDDAAFRMEMD